MQLLYHARGAREILLTSVHNPTVMHERHTVDKLGYDLIGRRDREHPVVTPFF